MKAEITAGVLSGGTLGFITFKALIGIIFGSIVGVVIAIFGKLIWEIFYKDRVTAWLIRNFKKR